MQRAATLALLFFTTTVIGCDSLKSRPKPGKITLQEAMKSVGEGLKDMKEAQGDLITGLAASEVVVVFNVSATDSENGKLYVEVGAPASVPVSAETGSEVSRATTASRGNQITIRFTNLLFADENSLIQKKSAEEIKELVKVVKDVGINLNKGSQSESSETAEEGTAE